MVRDLQHGPEKGKKKLFKQFRDWVELGVSKYNIVSFVASGKFSSIFKKNITSDSLFLKATQPVFMQFSFCSNSSQVCTGQSHFPFLIISELEAE